MDPLAHLHAIIGRHCHQAKVEELAKIRPQKQAIECVVQALPCEGLDVRSLEHRQCVPARNGAAALIGVGDQRAKGALPSAWPDRCRCTISGRLIRLRDRPGRYWICRQSGLDLVPEPHAVLRRVERFPHDDVPGEIVFHFNPGRFRPEVRGAEDTASDLGRG
jgi:hypothetical protein